MERTVLFQKNANVLTASGKQIGSLERIVLNPDSKVVTDIVIQTGALFNKEYRVVPIDLVAETSEDQIRLRNEAEGLESFPPFEERKIVSENDEHPGSTASAPPVVYGVPGMGPAVIPGPAEQLVTKMEQNIPEGTVALKEGAKVFTADDKHIGNVDRVLVDPSVNQATHLIITQGLLVKERKLLPMKWVTMLGEDSVHLGVTEAEINELDSDSAAE
jgi:uncharacterized protein YrrD